MPIRTVSTDAKVLDTAYVQYDATGVDGLSLTIIVSNATSRK